MASFYRFQRVRLARPYYPENEGLEGVIIEFLEAPLPIYWRGPCDVLVHWGVGDETYQHTNQLEPLRYLPAPEDFVTTERVYEPALPAYVGAA